MKTTITIIAICAAIVGCATTGQTGMGYTPIVDLRADQQASYQADLSACTSFANQRLSAGQGAAGGAIFGAILGGLLGAALGNGRLAADMAIVGGVTAAGSGAAAAEGTQRDIIRRCLANRGYAILD